MTSFEQELLIYALTLKCEGSRLEEGSFVIDYEQMEDLWEDIIFIVQVNFTCPLAETIILNKITEKVYSDKPMRGLVRKIVEQAQKNKLLRESRLVKDTVAQIFDDAKRHAYSQKPN